MNGYTKVIIWMPTLLKDNLYLRWRYSLYPYNSLRYLAVVVVVMI